MPFFFYFVRTKQALTSSVPRSHGLPSRERGGFLVEYSIMVKAVIFDVDGLMFDTEPLFSKVQFSIAEKRGKIFTPEIKHKMMGQKQIDGIKVLLRELKIEENPEIVLQEYIDGYVELIKKEIKPMPGLFELLYFLERENIRKAVATSSMREWIDVIFDKFNLSSRFEFITSAEECERGKPDPEEIGRASCRERV